MKEEIKQRMKEMEGCLEVRAGDFIWGKRKGKRGKGRRMETRKGKEVVKGSREGREEGKGREGRREEGGRRGK